MRLKYTPPIGWMTRGQAATYLGISLWKLRYLLKRHGILANREGGSYIYRVEDVEALARSMYSSLKDEVI